MVDSAPACTAVSTGFGSAQASIKAGPRSSRAALRGCGGRGSRSNSKAPRSCDEARESSPGDRAGLPMRGVRTSALGV